MDKETLLGMLKIKPTTPPPSQGGGNAILTPNQGVSQGVTPEDTCVKLNKWELAQGEECLAHHPGVLKNHPQPELAMADFLGLSFLPNPELHESCLDSRRHEFVSTLTETPDYKNLHQSTQLNYLASQMAAHTFAQEFSKLLGEDEKRQKKQLQEGKKPNPQKAALQSEMACLKAVGRALATAQEEVEELQEACKGLGLGDGGDGKTDTKKIAQIFQHIKNDHMLRQIFNRAGRFRRVAQSKQRQKIGHGYDDLVGIEQAGDVGRLLPQELAKLADEDMEWDTLRRLVENQTLCRYYKGVVPVGKGPVVVCVDESGSMSGDPLWNAKAFALAMAWVAQHQKRFCALVGYSGGTKGTLCILPPGKWNQEELLEWLEHFYGAGTTLDVPLKELPEVYWPKLLAAGCPRGKTDVICLTDGIVHLGKTMKDNFLAWKAKEKVKMISIILANHAGQMGEVSDEVHLARTLEVGESGIQNSLSI